MKSFLTLLASTISGLVILWVDARPNWDDTGITVGMIFIAAGLISFINPKRPFICATAVSLWIPLYQIANFQNYSTLVVFIVGFIGAYAGSFLRKWID
jgi:hypothetical protein